MTFFLDIKREEIAKEIAKTAGSPSGIAETANAIEVKNISAKSNFSKTPRIKIIATIPKTINPICFENLSNLFSIGVFTSLIP